jgi:hypothetical protein
MKHCRSYPTVMRRWYRPVEHECPLCHRTLREVMTLSKRTVITLSRVIKLNHAGYRCPDPQCAGHQRTYRSAAADALALPGFPFGVDIVLLVGRLHLGKNETVDEVHEKIQQRLAPLCYATDAAWRITTGGSRMRLGVNSWSSRPAGWIALVGESSTMRP